MQTKKKRICTHWNIKKTCCSEITNCWMPGIPLRSQQIGTVGEYGGRKRSFQKEGPCPQAAAFLTVNDLSASDVFNFLSLNFRERIPPSTLLRVRVVSSRVAA